LNNLTIRLNNIIVFTELGEYHFNLDDDPSQDMIKFFEKNNYKSEL